jgi:hypothetical protein
MNVIWPRTRRFERRAGEAATPSEFPTMEIPPDLIRSCPRETTWTGLGWLSLVFVSVLVLGGLAFTVYAAIDSTRNKALDRQMAGEGRLVTGHVIRSVQIRGDHPRRIVDFDYRVDGATLRGRTEMGLRGTPEYKPGSEVSVTYLSSNPSTAWIVGHEPDGVPLIAILVILIGLLASAISILWRLLWARNLLAEGRPALARVTDVRRVHWRGASWRPLGRVSMPMKHSRRMASLEFQLLSGATHVARAEVSGSPPPVGSTVVVLYDREKPNRVGIYPFRTVQLRDAIGSGPL